MVLSNYGIYIFSGLLLLTIQCRLIDSVLKLNRRGPSCFFVSLIPEKMPFGWDTRETRLHALPYN